MRHPVLAVLALSLSTACRAGGGSTVTERLWVSELPSNPRAPFSAFVTTRVRDGVFVGSFYRGSMYRGTHQAIRWNAQGETKVTVQTLQDERDHTLRLRECKPSTGFHLCVQVEGDREFAGRYQSRRRWSVERPGKKAVPDALESLERLAAEDDAIGEVVAEAGRTESFGD